MTETLANGFRDHGVATPVSCHRGMVATVDGDGRDVLLVWLFDHRGGYGLLLIDAETGNSEFFASPFDPGGDCPFASLLSRRNRYYTHFNSWFAEFDPVARAFTAVHRGATQMAMSMTEDDAGVIWLASYPNSALAAYDPGTGRFTDYGSLHSETWQQYPRSIAADDCGWIYFALGNTASQIVAFEPETRAARTLLEAGERVTGMAQVYRDVNGKVYGAASSDSADWLELYDGRMTRIGPRPDGSAVPCITGSQGLCHRQFPSGRTLVDCDLIERRLTTADPQTETSATRDFAYESEGAHLMGVARAPDGTLCGGTSFPMRFFRFDPVADGWENREAYGQFNTVATGGDQFFVGGYIKGFLLAWDPARLWRTTLREAADSNPCFLTDCAPDIYRPHALLPLPDGQTVVMSGTPDYGHTGGGLLFWDLQRNQGELIRHTEILPEHATMSLLALPDGTLLGGSTTAPGTGGQRRAEQAELYIMEMTTKTILWHQPPLPDCSEISDLYLAADGMVYGIADVGKFFVFDPDQRIIRHHEDLAPRLGICPWQQGPRLFIGDGDGNTYLLLRRGLARIDAEVWTVSLLAESPLPVTGGGDYCDGRIYFASGSHLGSYQLPEVS